MEPFVGDESLSSRASRARVISGPRIVREKDWQRADKQTHRTPCILYKEIFKHIVEYANTVNTINMAYKCAIKFVQYSQFSVSAVVKRNLFSICNETRMCRSEIAFQLRLDSSQLSKTGSHFPEKPGREYIIQSYGHHSLATNALCQLIIENHSVQDWLCQVRVEGRERIAKPGHIVANQA